MSTRAPSLGRGYRAQRGGVGFLFCRSRLLFAFLIGKGDRVAVDRVLSYIVDLRRSPSLSFIPLVPYPARSARHLPHAGKALFRGQRFPPSNLHPFGAPPSIGRRELSTRAPSLGRGCRAQRGGVGFLFGRRSRLLFASPMQGKLCYPCAIIHNQHCPYEGKPKRRRKHPAPL